MRHSKGWWNIALRNVHSGEPQDEGSTTKMTTKPPSKKERIQSETHGRWITIRSLPIPCESKVWHTFHEPHRIRMCVCVMRNMQSLQSISIDLWRENPPYKKCFTQKRTGNVKVWQWNALNIIERQRDELKDVESNWKWMRITESIRKQSKAIVIQRKTNARLGKASKTIERRSWSLKITQKCSQLLENIERHRRKNMKRHQVARKVIQMNPNDHTRSTYAHESSEEWIVFIDHEHRHMGASHPFRLRPHAFAWGIRRLRRWRE